MFRVVLSINNNNTTFCYSNKIELIKFIYHPGMVCRFTIPLIKNFKNNKYLKIAISNTFLFNNMFCKLLIGLLTS